ncbi:DUF3987 domain-containing protein [Aquitalea sp. ASV11]|uniref:DUF3987 domain-containing protein n=1 Tax=Aquitalea sp. ASV11 TaxID=2795103 RepID=UPI0018EB51F7|nr:DUF3987 domain-containing protein [Aquitalea sp. ASV11]
MTNLVITASEDARKAASRLASSTIAGGYTLEALHVYADTSGATLYWRIRCKHSNGQKWIRPMHHDGSQYRIGEPSAPDAGKPLYGLYALALQPDDTVFVVEGEKAADALLRLGNVAVTSGAADSANAADWTPLRGRSVIFWPDNDEAGAKYLQACLPLLAASGVASAKVIDVSALSLPDKGDAADWLAKHQPAELAQLPLIEVPATGPESFERDTLPTQWPANCLPGAMQQAAQAIAEHVQAPEPLAAMAVLAAVAHIAQRTANADHPKMGPMPCSLFVLSLANSGDRKSACFSLATRPIDSAEKEARQKHKQDYDAAMQERKASRKNEEEPTNKLPSDPRTLYSDSTLEKIARDFVQGSRPALSWSSDEAAQFFDGHSMKAETRAGALGVLTRLFDGRGVERDRVGQGLGSGYRFDVRFGLFLSGQPSVIASSLNDPLLREQGLLPRFILSSPTSLAGERFLDEASLSKRADADARSGQYWRILTKLNNAPWPTNEYDGLVLPTATITPDAKARWLVFYNATEARLSPENGDLTGSLQAFGGRAGELALRVATVFAVWRYYENAADKLEVLPDDIDRAAALVNYSLAEWLRLSTGHQLSATERDARDLLAFLQKKPEQWTCFTKQQLAQRGPGKMRSDSRRRTAALDELIRRKWLVFDGTHFTLASPTSNH